MFRTASDGETVRISGTRVTCATGARSRFWSKGRSVNIAGFAALEKLPISIV